MAVSVLWDVMEYMLVNRYVDCVRLVYIFDMVLLDFDLHRLVHVYGYQFLHFDGYPLLDLLRLQSVDWDGDRIWDIHMNRVWLGYGKLQLIFSTEEC